MAVKMLDLWGSQHDTDERAGETADWHSLARQATIDAAVEVARARATSRIAALQAAAPAPGTEVDLVESDEDAGAKTSWETRRARVESVTTNTIILRAAAGYRVNVAWQDLLAGHIRITGPGTEALTAALAVPALAAGA